MGNAIEDILGRLRSDGDLAEIYATTDAWAREGKTKDLVSLWTAIEGADAEGDAKRLRAQIADHVEEALALTPGDDRVDALFELYARERTKSVVQPRTRDTRARALASRLGFGQTKAELLSAMRRHGPREEFHEILACWMHEVVLRGSSLDREPEVVHFRDHMASHEHPLASLALDLLEAEREATTYMPLYGTSAIEEAALRLESGTTSTHTMPPGHDATSPRATRVDDAIFETRIVEAVMPWKERSKGKLEARVYTVAPALEPQDLGKTLLRTLGLECLDGASGLRADRTRADAVWGALFAAAANGGAYSSGLGGAYGRRAAWNSLAALVGEPENAGVPAIAAKAERCAFLRFGAKGPWFYDIAWDIGALVLRPDGESLAVVAATDTD